MNNGVLGLEPSLHHPPQQNLRHNSSSSSSHSSHQNPQTLIFKGMLITSKPLINLNNEENDSVFSNNTNNESTDSQWHRMKWTDSMVRLLITVVSYNVDEAVTDDSVTYKKGKWKSVSNAMMEGGFRVSPQQCEDKFNDLNKRYKRLNEILGKEIAFRVVENQCLLEKIGHLSQKMKVEVKKLLSSKHLFYREMCGYHNDIGNVNGSDPSQEQQEKGKEVELWASKREELREEMMGMIEDGTKSLVEKRRWMMGKLMKLEEEKIKFEEEGLELKKARLKWMKFIMKKEMEMDVEKMEKKKLEIENEKMIILVRKKEVELAVQHYN